MAMWNPWRGCRRCSDGCKFCYIHKGDFKRGIDTEAIVRTDNFYAPVKRSKSGAYAMKSGQTVYTCFSTDFLIEDADKWRGECWEMIKERPDLNFLFLTKRIGRFIECAPADWGGGYDNVTVGCTVENARNAEAKLSVFKTLTIKHKNIICQPLIGEIDLENYLDGVELVVVGGESDACARPLNYDWVLKIREQCIHRNVSFEFRQCGSNFIKDGKLYCLNARELRAQARKAEIDFKAKTADAE